MALTLRLSDEDAKVLAQLAARRGVSPQEAVIQAIHDVADKRPHALSVRELSAAGRERYADLLDRLGK